MFEFSVAGKGCVASLAMIISMTLTMSGRVSGRLNHAVALELYSYLISFTPLALLGYMLYLVSRIR